MVAWMWPCNHRRTGASPALTREAGSDYIAPFRVKTPVFALSEFMPKVSAMSRRCELTGVGPMVGHNVSHSNIKSKRRFLPALKTIRVASDSLGQQFNIRVSNAALRTLDYRGGLDAFLVKANDDDLSPRVQKIKRQIKAKLAAVAPAA
jgi:large subunit ribosomal protein L28